MRTRYPVTIFLAVLAVAPRAFSASSYQKTSDAVVFALKKALPTDPGMLKVQVCTPDIIRIVASPETTFSARPSLMVQTTSWPPVPWSVRERDGLVEIVTSALIVRVDPQNGALAFLDSTGRSLLRENGSGGKIITPADVMGEQTYHIQQLFDSPGDEAVYGLGGGQTSVMNYKGHNLDLYQHNMVEVVPFLVSSRRYGILWDNNSRLKFGDIRDFQPLTLLKPRATDGTAGGLTAEYFRDAGFDTLFTSRSPGPTRSGCAPAGTRSCGLTASSSRTSGDRTGSRGRISRGLRWRPGSGTRSESNGSTVAGRSV
jgi:alpha-D-xyloside xylohydrolase